MARVVLLVIGLLSLAAGVYSIVNPYPATLAATLIAGWSLALLGALLTFAAFTMGGGAPRPWAVVLGLLTLAAGVSVLVDPLAGMVSLTVLVGCLFLLSGAAKVAIGLASPRAFHRGLILLAGGLSLLLGVLILANLPASATSILGILLGIELLSFGLTALLIAATTRIEVHRY